MSDDEDDQAAESNANLYEGSLDGGDSLTFGPLVPTESERSLMERVRQELKHELKQVCIRWIMITCRNRIPLLHVSQLSILNLSSHITF
jgi:hypothetical protein